MISDKRNKPRFQAILEAAARIFRKKGYHHANISDIAKEIGLQKGSLYHYIDSKEDLLYEIVMSAVSTYIKSLKEVLNSNEEADILLKEAIIAHMYPMDIEFDRIYTFINELKTLPKESRKEAEIEIDNYEVLWLSIFEQGKKSGIFRADLDSKIIMLSIFGMCNWTLRWYRPGGKYNTRDLAQIYARSILEGIKAGN